MSEHAVHTDNNSSILKITVNLAVTCLVSGAILAGAYFLTRPIAAKQEVLMEQKSKQALVSDAASFEEVEGQKEMSVAKAQDGSIVAYVVSVESRGYGGAIKMLVAVTPEGKVYNFKILSANETPGLGTKASESPFKDQFPGKTSEQLVVTKDPSNTTNVQAMTGATITSKAVTKGVKAAVDEVNAYLGEGNSK
ncbi:FMN-binding protein [Oscillospiraceae bacterium WX1]